MEVNGYKLSERAAMAARGERPAPPKKPMKIDPRALALATINTRTPVTMALPERSAQDVFAPYKFNEAVLPEGVAMDACLPAPNGMVSSWAIAQAFHEGQGFFGYPYLAELQQRSEYRHAAEIWAEHAVRKWIEIKGSTPEKRKLVEDAFTALNVRDVFQQWIFHDHSFGRGQIFLDFGDADKEKELMRPLVVKDVKVNQDRPLQRLTVVEPMWVSPGTYATSNPLRHDFYRPEQWFVYGRRVHTSRFLTITSRPVSDMLKPAYGFGGLSLTQMMKPYVDNWLQTRQAVSDMLNSYSVMVLATDMSAVLSGGSADALYSRIDMFNATRDNRGSMTIDKNEETLTNVAVPLSGLSELLAQSQEQLASVSRIPLSIYLQITPTGLNATSDGETRNFYADVHSYQEKNVRQPLQKVFEIVQLSVLGAIDPEMSFVFEPLWELGEVEKATVRKSNADADVAYVNAMVVSPDEVRERLSNDDESLYHGVDLTDPAPEPPEEPDVTGEGGDAPAKTNAK